MPYKCGNSSFSSSQTGAGFPSASASVAAGSYFTYSNHPFSQQKKGKFLHDFNCMISTFSRDTTSIGPQYGDFCAIICVCTTNKMCAVPTLQSISAIPWCQAVCCMPHPHTTGQMCRELITTPEGDPGKHALVPMTHLGSQFGGVEDQADPVPLGKLVEAVGHREQQVRVLGQVDEPFLSTIPTDVIQLSGQGEFVYAIPVKWGIPSCQPFPVFWMTPSCQSTPH